MGEPQNDSARGHGRWIGLDVGEIQVHGHEYAAFVLADLKYGRVLLAAKGLVKDADSIVAVLA